MSFPLVSLSVLVISVISTSAFTNTQNPSLHQKVVQIHSKRRHHNLFSSLLPSKISNDNNAVVSENKVLVLGGSGFVGRHVIEALNLKKIPFIATSKSGQEDDTTIALDVTSDTAAQRVIELCASNDISTVVSTVGTIFTECDYEVNAASGQIAKALASSKDVSVDKFIFIGNSQRIRNVCKTVSSLQEYARGKEESERLIQQTIDADDRLHCCIVRPTFIYGGDEFGWNPPRLPTKFGEIIEALLGLYPVQALSEFLPDALGVALEAPSNVKAVAGSIVNVIVGLDDSYSLDTREDIIMSASRRPYGTSHIDSESAQTRREELKLCLSQHAKEYTPEQNFAMLEELEQLKPVSTRPTDDSSLNGRWNFCFDVEPDVGTGFIKDLFEGGEDGFTRRILDFQGVHMEIGNDQSTIQLVVSVSLLKNPFTVILHTSLVPAPTNPEGTMFLEKFEGVEVNGIRLWYPNAWKKSRFLEFSYLDDAFAVARGSGGEPHFLLRGNK
eukprot:CAMPEP_0201690888 /NCGR_PEP_ID=MMETSP0578-20130828/4195_1 /ASSEMBLY_ACC=CAM_ASM_000663 /TAXON_ID=267565 /ORGANISM="Skeletonema grethea, Strain CCMP 1804" /LENGTH=499 /DNA_ID=CAMNT_0048175977 /DNA_START=58 /DNA_END=1557 /DNA_ORIENTATION=+